jgi:hypothetical protein
MKKHALTISWALLAAMTLAALVRLALSPDFPHLTLTGRDGSLRPFQGLWLLAFPAVMAVMILTAQLPLRRAGGSADVIRAWREHWGVSHLIFVLYFAACQTLILLNSLGMTAAFLPDLKLRGFVVFVGLVLVVMFNRLPKLPPIPAASSPPSDVVPWGQTARLISSIMVGLGLMILITGLVGLTPQTAPFLSALLTASFILALLAIVYHFWRWHSPGWRR